MPPELQNFLLGCLSNLEPCLAFDQVITYHGTRTSALQSIRDNGILSHPFKHYHPSRFYKADRGASVYLTEYPSIAAQWALSEVNDPSLATILQVVVPKEGLHPDEEAPEAERFVGDIPPEWIQATYSLNPDGSLGQAVPFHADPRLSQSVEDATKTKRFMVIKHSSPGVISVAGGRGDAAMDSKLEPLRQWMLERFVERAPVMAMDRSTFAPLKSEFSSIAMDRGPTARRQNEDGDLHVAISNISKATVNPYWGHEIPNWRELKLEPDKKYMLLRDPKELEKAAHTFNNLPILAEHKPRTADKHPAHLVVGSTGTDAQYAHPYLKNSLVFWTKPAIDAIEEDEQKELSCAYHYDPDMTPGVYEGQRYDGVMRNIRGNHVAQVRDGRAGSDVVVQDSEFDYTPEWEALERVLLQFFGHRA